MLDVPINTDILYRSRDEIITSELQVAWNLATIDETVALALFERRPLVKALQEALSTQLPHPRSYEPAQVGPFLRPVGHGRSFYINVDALRLSKQGNAIAEGHVAVKGSEVASDNYGVWMRQLRCQRQFWGFNGGDEFTSFRSSIDTTLNNLERWPLIERKVPGAMTLPEALAEASIALAIQRDYLQRYGEFARIPLPLLVLRWPDSVSYRVLLELQPLLSSRAMEVVEQTIARGLAVFIYYYPGLPIRLMSLGGAQGRRTPILVADTEVVQNIPSVGFGWTYARRADQMSGLIDVRGLIERWTDLFVKMLALGYLPKDPGSLLTADCLQPWNVVLDGGFVDIDSVVKIDALDDADLDDTIRRSLRGLVINIAYLMLGRIALAMDFRDRFPELTWTVLDDVRKRLEHEAATGGIPATLQRLVAPTCVHSDLDRLFRRATSASVDNGHE